MTPNGKTICLNMIVKNEKHVIERCFAAVRPLIDSWVIVDTGSTDGTQELIRKTLSDIPGELFERPWRDFGTNRSEAIELARERADYLLVVDADEVTTLDPDFAMPPLERDAYAIRHQITGGFLSFRLTSLFSTRKPWRYDGPMHEVLVCDEPFSLERLDGICITGMFDSARNQVDTRTKYLGDAAVLEAALAAAPDHARHTYYLAQSYRDAGEWEKAIAHYERRAELGGWDEEIWSALYEAGRLKWHAGHSVSDVSAALLRAYQARPIRAEPLVLLAMMHRMRQEYALAHLYASKAADIPRPNDGLFLNEWAYAWQALDEQAVAASWLGRFGEALELCDRILRHPDIPDGERQRIRANRSAFAQRCNLPDVASDAEPRVTRDMPRVAVITPYCYETPELLAQCHDSVLAQTYACTHVLIADGNPAPQFASADALHIALPRAHGDNGNTARMIGAISAINQGFDAIAFLDADNWFEPEHIAGLVALHRSTGADVCTAARRIVRVDGSHMFDDWESNGEEFVDTSCLWLTGRALELIPLWGTMPVKAGPIGDRIFWSTVLNQGLSRAHNPTPTVAFRSRYEFHYNHLGEPAPQGAKDVESIRACIAWFSQDAAAQRATYGFLPSRP